MDNQTREIPFLKLVESANKAFNQRKSFNQQILILSATILGIVVAFQNTQSESIIIRWLFVASIILFALGILMMAIVLFSYMKLSYRSFYAMREEYKKYKSNKPFNNIINENVRCYAKFCEIFSYFCLILGLFSLVTYAVMCALHY